MFANIGDARRLLVNFGWRVADAAMAEVQEALTEAMDQAREIVADALGADKDAAELDVVTYRNAQDAEAKVAAALVDPGDISTIVAEQAISVLAARTGGKAANIAERIAGGAVAAASAAAGKAAEKKAAKADKASDPDGD